MLKQTFIISIFTTLAILCILACNQSNNNVLYPPTTPIDTGVYKKLQEKFRVSVYKTPEYLGGLTPNYPIVGCYQLVFDFHGKRLSQDTDWVSGLFFPSARKFIIKANNNYILINNRKELQKIYAPISSEQEALAYAILYNPSFAAFEDFFRKKQYNYIGDKPAVSYAIKKGDHFIVQLFSYKAFGCDHPYYVENMQVNIDGSVKLISKAPSFKDPADDGLCVD